MNEALQSKLVEVLDLGKVGILNAFDAIKAQAPELVREIIRWGIITRLVWFIPAFMTTILLFVYRFRIFIWVRGFDDYFPGGEYLVFTLMLVAPVLITISESFNLLNPNRT